MNGKKKKRKDYFLSSGLPLEYSVRQTLEDLDVWEAREYKYERVNEAGIPTLFSVDVHATKSWYGPKETDNPYHVYLELFVECKYRHDGIEWVFTPDEFDSNELGPQFSEIFIILDSLTAEYKIDRSELDSFSQFYDLCGKGIELSGAGSNPKSITQSIQQLRFAIADQVADALEHQVYPLLGPIEPLFIFVPIVVTTAKLRRMNPGITIEDIKNASELEDISEQKDLLILHERPDNELSKHTKKKLLDAFGSADIRNKLSERLASNHKTEFLSGKTSMFFSDVEGRFESYVNMFAARYPSLFLVIHYSRFKDAMTKLLSFFETPSKITSLR
jgi:hypothetical protein